MSSVHGANSASSAIQQWQYLQSLVSSGSATQPSAGSDPAASFDPFAGLGGGQGANGGGSGPNAPISLGTMSALIDAQAQATGGLSQHQQKVFGELDGNSDGSVSKAELEKAFGADNQAASDYVMKKLDADGDGAISQAEFAAGTTKGGHRHHIHAAQQPDGQDGANKNPLSQLLQAAGASSTSTANADGSSTTTITYADGSKVSMTSAAPPAGGDNAGGSNSSGSARSNLLEQLIKLQAQLTSSATATSSTTA